DDAVLLDDEPASGPIGRFDELDGGGQPFGDQLQRKDLGPRGQRTGEQDRKGKPGQAMAEGSGSHRRSPDIRSEIGVSGTREDRASARSARQSRERFRHAPSRRYSPPPLLNKAN